MQASFVEFKALNYESRLLRGYQAIESPAALSPGCLCILLSHSLFMTKKTSLKKLAG